MQPSVRIERMLWDRGVVRVAGIDEAGRGAWAGPVVAAAVVLPNRSDLLGLLASALAAESAAPDEHGRLGARVSALIDSKALSAAQRVVADRVIRRWACGVGVGVASPAIVDDFGLSFAGQLAFWRAVRSLPDPPDYLLVDGFPLWSPVHRQLAVIDGDARCTSIAAASIVAKVARDRMMGHLDEECPGYGFGRHVGYGTAEHQGALRRLGPSPHHRRTYQPVAALLAGTNE